MTFAGSATCTDTAEALGLDAHGVGVGLRMRPAADDDLPFLRRLYADTRTAEMVAMTWTGSQLAAFLSMQFEAQHRAYRAYPNTEYWLLTIDGEPVGRLYLQHAATALHVVDISLLSELRGRGIGTALLGAVLALGTRTDRRVTLQVARNNRAQSLYRRLGFVVIQDDGASLSMTTLYGRPGG